MNQQEIISLRKKVHQEQYGSIHKPVTYINGKRYHFAEQAIPTGNMLIHLPREFSNMPEYILKQKYPSENRPQVIKTSSDMCINFAFKLLPIVAKEEDMIIFRNIALNAVKKLCPQHTYLNTGAANYGPKKNQLFCWYDYCGPTLDMEVYSFNAFMSHNGKPVFFLFNCPKDEYEGWQPIVFEVIDTIRDKPIGWKGEDEK